MAETDIERGSATMLETGIASIKAVCETLPDTPGVYRMIDEVGRVLYIGKALSLRKRVLSYTTPGRLPYRLQRMVALTRSMEFVHTRSEVEALMLEASLVKNLQPPYNILLRDGKAFPSIFLSNGHPFPLLRKHRGAKQEKGLYFGPFANAGAVTRTIDIVQKVFKLRNCSDTFFANRTRPCLQYHIKRCTAPCVGYVDIEQYGQQARDARDFLEGRSAALQDRLAALMQDASAKDNFEEAAQLRDKLRALADVQAQQSIGTQGLQDADVITIIMRENKSAVQVFFFRAGQNYGNHVFFPRHDPGVSEGDVLAAFMAQFYENKPVPPKILVNVIPAENELLQAALSEKAQRQIKIICPMRGALKQLIDFAMKSNVAAMSRHMTQHATDAALLEKLAALLSLPAPPQRIEVYDNSHLGGTKMVGGMIVAGPDGLRKRAYRTFNIRQAQRGDDVGMMREVMQRRFVNKVKNQEEDIEIPDLLLIDGGRGQLNAVREVLSDCGLAPGKPLCVAIAKGEDRNAGRETLYIEGRPPIKLTPDDPVSQYLQRLRDEAHRFVIGAQRRRRKTDIVHSQLDDIPGIGAARKRALLHYFGSAQAVTRAGIEDLLRVKGVSPAMAKNIFAYFHDH